MTAETRARVLIVEDQQVVAEGLAALIDHQNNRPAIRTQLERLTPREKEVLGMMAEGVASREIGNQLGISYTTVRTHIRSLGGKLGAHSKLETIVKARELALVE